MERKHINPEGVYKHPAFTRVVTVKNPGRLVWIAGQTPSDENYKAVHVGDYRGQYIHVLNMLTLALKSAGATWDDVVYKRTFVLDVDEMNKVTRDPATPVPWDRNKPPPSTLIGVTRLSWPDFLLEIDLMAVVAE